MAIKLSNYGTAFAPDLIQQAKKNKVRECDETEKGHFVAYVDDGNESFDVSLTVKAGGEITKHTCECQSTANLCRHKAALIIHIANGKKIKDGVKAGKKQNKTEALIDDIDPHALREWVRALVSKNKDIELSFIHHFSVKEQLTPLEVAKLVNDAVKAVAGNKRAIDLTQLKKIVGLWSDTLAPIVEYYHANVTNEKAFLNFHEMLETCMAFQFKVDSSSNKVPKFIEENLLKSVEPVNNLQVEEAWDKAVGYFIKYVPAGENWVRMRYLLYLKNIFEISSEGRKIKIIDWLARQYEKSKPRTLVDGTAYTKFVFEITAAHNLFSKYSRLFKPITFDNEYNRKLIRLLIDNNNLGEAKKYCNEQMMHNYRDEYNLPYLKFLKEIALLQKDEEELGKLRTRLFPLEFDFADYMFILGQLHGEEKKKWRNKALARSRNVQPSYKKAAAEFFFNLMDTDESYRKMIDYIDSYTPYQLILQYFEVMALADKDRLLEMMLRKSDESWHLSEEDKEKEAASFPALFALFGKHYTAAYLKNAISNKEKERWHYSPNKLFVYIKQQLLMDKK